MIAAEQFRRRLMASSAEVDCGQITIQWEGMSGSPRIKVLGDYFNLNQVSAIEVNGSSVPIRRYISLLQADTVVVIRFRNLYDCNYLLSNIGLVVGLSTGSMYPQTVDVSQLDTSKTYTMIEMFRDCRPNGVISGLNALQTSRVKNMNGMFRDATGYDASELALWNTSRVEDFSYMFYDNRSVSTGTPSSFDLSAWNTSSAKQMGLMFRRQRNATSINVSGWDTSKVTEMGNMFSGCRNVVSLDLSSFSFSAIKGGGVTEDDESKYTENKSMYAMFGECSKLRELKIMGAISEEANTSYLMDGITTQGVFIGNRAHIDSYNSKIISKLPSTWTTQLL